jgi:hypothetical protein
VTPAAPICFPEAIIIITSRKEKSRYDFALSLDDAAPNLPPTHATASPSDALDNPLIGPVVIEEVDILALQSTTYGGGSVAVAAPMAQPDAEPVEEYEYVHLQELHFPPVYPYVQIPDMPLIAMKDFRQIFRCCRT